MKKIGWAASMTLPALVMAIKGIFDWGNGNDSESVRVGTNWREKTKAQLDTDEQSYQTEAERKLFSCKWYVPGYTFEGAQKNVKTIISAHNGGDKWTGYNYKS